MNLSCLRKMFLQGAIKFNDYRTFRKMFVKMNKRNQYTRKQFTLDRYDDDECLLLLRFKKKDILKLCRALQLPKFFILANHNQCPGLEGLCLVLRRLSYPNRLCDLVETFHRDVTTMPRLFNCTLELFNDNWSSKITTFNDQPWLTTEQLEFFAQAYDSKEGFMEGHFTADLQTQIYTEEAINWIQEDPLSQIPKCCFSKWFNRKTI